MKRLESNQTEQSWFCCPIHFTGVNLIYLGRPKLLSSTVDSDGRTLHVPNLIRGEKECHLYCLK